MPTNDINEKLPFLQIFSKGNPTNQDCQGDQGGCVYPLFFGIHFFRNCSIHSERRRILLPGRYWGINLFGLWMFFHWITVSPWRACMIHTVSVCRAPGSPCVPSGPCPLSPHHGGTERMCSVSVEHIPWGSNTVRRHCLERRITMKWNSMVIFFMHNIILMAL